MRDACEQARRAARALSRRDVLQIGALGALGLTLSDVLGLRAAGAAASDDYAAILLWLTGGPSQFDTFDPKPDAPSQVRGPFRAIPTNVDGIQVTEIFPRTARHADKYALLRAVYHPLDNHVTATGWMVAGRPHDSLNYPPMGSVVARLRGGRGDMPPFVTLPALRLIDGYNATQHSQTAGDLGPAYNPLVPDGIPGTAGFGVRDLGLPDGIDPTRFDRRMRLLDQMDRAIARDPADSPRRGLSEVYERATDLIRSAAVRAAFDLERESPATRDRYGRNGFGQSVLLARRLVEAGVRFVTVNWPSYFAWDQHGNIESGLRNLGPQLDHALASLFEDLHERGMLERTLVLCMGEFGRTPRINDSAGRDHWVHCMTVLIGGARIRGGQVVGSTKPDGYPDERPVHARDMVATAYRALGIDLEAELPTVVGRPIQVLPGASPVEELLR